MTPRGVLSFLSTRSAFERVANNSSTVTLELNGKLVRLHDHAAEALGQLAAELGTIAGKTLAENLHAHAQHHELDPVALSFDEEFTLVGVLALVPPESVSPELRDELAELQATLGSIFDPE